MPVNTLQLAATRCQALNIEMSAGHPWRDKDKKIQIGLPPQRALTSGKVKCAMAISPQGARGSLVKRCHAVRAIQETEVKCDKLLMSVACYLEASIISHGVAG